MRYSDVIGQNDIKDFLQRQLLEKRVPHAQLFTGPEGSGKLPMALAYASALLCQHPVGGEACGQCQACRMVERWVHPDLHFVFPVVKPKSGSEAVSDTYLTQWREQLTNNVYFNRQTWYKRMGVENQQPIISVKESESILEKLSLKSSQGGYKVMLVWLPELMNEPTANKLLKILEEPPAETAFLLVSDEPERLLPTILSRTQRVEFRPLSEQELMQALMSRNVLQEDDAKLVAHLSGGSYVAACRQLQIDEDRALFFDMFVLLMRLSYMRKIKDMYEWANRVSEWGRERQKQFLDYCQRLVRENFICNFQQPELNYMSRQEADFAVRFARFINERNVIGIMDELSAARRDIGQNVNPRMVFFDFALKMIVLLIQ